MFVVIRLSLSQGYSPEVYLRLCNSPDVCCHKVTLQMFMAVYVTIQMPVTATLLHKHILLSKHLLPYYCYYNNCYCYDKDVISAVLLFHQLTLSCSGCCGLCV